MKKYKYDVVSIIDEIGTYKTDKLKNGNKLCPHFFTTRKELLIQYINIEFGSHMPHSETFGYLTEAMLNDGIKTFELEEDKSNFLFGEELEDKRSKDLGYYHCRNGSLAAVLLSWKNSPNHNKTYREYLEDQPKSETLRLCGWYAIMGGNATPILKDLKIGIEEWNEYIEKFKIFHGL